MTNQDSDDSDYGVFVNNEYKNYKQLGQDKGFNGKKIVKGIIVLILFVCFIFVYKIDIKQDNKNFQDAVRSFQNITLDNITWDLLRNNSAEFIQTIQTAIVNMSSQGSLFDYSQIELILNTLNMKNQTTSFIQPAKGFIYQVYQKIIKFIGHIFDEVGLGDVFKAFSANSTDTRHRMNTTEELLQKIIRAANQTMKSTQNTKKAVFVEEGL